MTDQEIIEEVAKFDGTLMQGEEVAPCHWVDPRLSDFGAYVGASCKRQLPDYPNFRNAIVPVIEKLQNEKPWSSNPNDYPTWRFTSELLKILGIELWDNGKPLRAPFDIAWLILKATPRQLCEALLRAHGKWKD